MMSDRIILHVDLNNFFASVEQLLNSDLLGKPIAVCGDPDKRHGIVLAKSIEAKNYGVQTAEAIWQAKNKCPNLIIVAPHYSEYIKYSKIVKDIYVKYTSEVESFGLDECWLDVTNSIKLFGSVYEIAEKIRNDVKNITGGLTVSIGISFTKVFAKLGSDLKKPDAISVIDRTNYKTIAWPLKASEMLYVGKSTEKKLKQLNIYTIGDIANADQKMLVRLFGKIGAQIHESANGINDEPVKNYLDAHIPESIGNGTTTPKDVASLNDAKSVIYALSEVIGFRLRTYNAVGEGVSISIRNVQLHTISKQGKMDFANSSPDVIAKKALELLEDIHQFKKDIPLRTITVCVYNLSLAGDYVQSSLFSADTFKMEQLNKSIDKLRGKFGYNVLQRAINIETIFTCDAKEIEDDFISFKKN